MEPLVVCIRSAPSVEGIQVGVIVDKISLYAHNTLLFLKDISSLPYGPSNQMYLDTYRALMLTGESHQYPRYTP